MNRRKASHGGHEIGPSLAKRSELQTPNSKLRTTERRTLNGEPQTSVPSVASVR
jgi:hypothetical protein